MADKVQTIKKLIFVILAIAFISCNPFDEERVLDSKMVLNYLASKIEKYNNGTNDRDEIDEFLIGDIRNLDIDLIVKNDGMKNPGLQDLLRKMTV